MSDAREALKHRARLLMKQAPELKRHDALNRIAQDLGFSGWGGLDAHLKGDLGAGGGTYLSPKGATAFSNIWAANHLEASALREQAGGYLLMFKKHYMVVSADYIAHLGLDPEDPDWPAIGHDWAVPQSLEARDRLAGKLFRKQAPA